MKTRNIIFILFCSLATLSFDTYRESDFKYTAESKGSIIDPLNCAMDAWDYGMDRGNGDPYWEWFYTDWYFENFCNEDGTYKN